MVTISVTTGGGGSAVEIRRKGNGFETVAFAPQSFVRKLHLPADNPADAAYIKAVLADKPLGYWPLNKPAGARRFLDRSGNSFHGYAMNRIVAGHAGPLFGNSRAVTLRRQGLYRCRAVTTSLRSRTISRSKPGFASATSAHQPNARVISATPGATDSKNSRMLGWAIEVSRQADQKGVFASCDSSAHHLRREGLRNRDSQCDGVGGSMGTRGRRLRPRQRGPVLSQRQTSEIGRRRQARQSWASLDRDRGWNDPQDEYWHGRLATWRFIRKP